MAGEATLEAASGDVRRQALASAVGDPDSGQTRAPPASCAGSQGAPPDAEHRPQGSTLTRDEAFAIVRRARAAIATRRPVSDKTRNDYTRKVALIQKDAERNIGALDPDEWLDVLSKYAPVANSFFAHKAAAKWAVLEVVGRILSEQDRLQRSGQGPAWLQRVASLARALDLLARIEGATREAALQHAQASSRARHSKRSDLLRIERRAPDWRERILQAVKGSRHERAVQVLSLVGCRPEELARGVVLQRDPEDGRRIRVTIRGAKVTEASGQPWRRIGVRWDSVPGEWQSELDSAQGMEVRIKGTSALRSCLTRVSRKVLPKLPIASAYVFRHALARDLREEGWSAEDIGAALGHCVGETQARYGPRHRPGSGRMGQRQAGLIKEATTTQRGVRKLDRSGLERARKIAAETKRGAGRVGRGGRKR